MYLWQVKTVMHRRLRGFIEPSKLDIFLCEYGEETPLQIPREYPNLLIHNQLPPDHWEVDNLARLINKIKFLEVPDYLIPTTN